MSAYPLFSYLSIRHKVAGQQKNFEKMLTKLFIHGMFVAQLIAIVTNQLINSPRRTSDATYI